MRELGKIDIIGIYTKYFIQMFRYGKNEIYVVTTRFTNATWDINCRWRQSRKKLGCLYTVPRRPPPIIPLDTVMIVIEMNNEGIGQSPNGRVEGLGLCINRPLVSNLVVYGKRQYDRVAYAGRYRVDRNDLDERLLKRLEKLCFNGNCHLKRGSGFTSLPIAWLGKSLAHELRVSFRGAHNRFLEHKSNIMRLETVSRT